MRGLFRNLCVLAALLPFLAVLPVRADDEDPNARLSIPDSHTYVCYYSKEKKFEALTELLEKELRKVDSDCPGTQDGKQCDLEGKLYLLDDLANVYTYGRVDFEKAREMNERVSGVIKEIESVGLGSLPVSPYFNMHRFLYYTFYSGGGLFSSTESMDFVFDDKCVALVRKRDFDAVKQRVVRRRGFIAEKLGLAAATEVDASRILPVDPKLFEMYCSFVESITQYSPFERAYLKARMAARAMRAGGAGRELFLDTILSASSFSTFAVAQASIDGMDKVNRLNYWLALASITRGDSAGAILFHERLVDGIGRMEQSLVERYDAMAALLKQYYEAELTNKNKLRSFGKQLISGAASLGVFIAKIGVTALVAAGEVAAASAATGQGYSETPDFSLTRDTLDWVWKGHEWDYGVGESINQANFLNPVYELDTNDPRRFSEFMTPYALLLNRYLNKFELLAHMVSMGDAYFAQENMEKAEAQYSEAINIVERQRGTILSERERMAFFGFKQDLYAKIIRLMVAQEKYALALEYIERSKSRAFLDILGGGEVVLKSDEQQDVTTQDELIRAEIDSVLELTDAGTERVMHAMDKSLRGVAVVGGEVDGNSYGELRSLSTVSVLESAKIRALVPPDAALVEYFLDSHKAYILVVRRSGVKCVVMDLDYEALTDSIARLNRSILDLSFDNAYAKGLYAQLVGPIEEYLRCDRLIIVPHRCLHYLPFQVLMSGEGYLVERYALSYVPSATVLSIVREKPVAEGEKALVIGNPTGDLAFAEQEAMAIGSTLAGSEVVLGDSGTEALLKSRSDQFRVIHVATHGKFDAAHPLSSSLMFHPEGEDDGQLSTGELFSCNWRASLVTLSACQTGMGKYNSGDELIGLQRAVFFAGTQSLLASSWRVDDRSTSCLMERFYAHAGESAKDVALQHAQLDTMKEFEQPFHWASFKLVGAANKVFEVPDEMDMVWVPGGCFNMGSPEDEPNREDDEGPVHEVCVDGFWMSRYEVTNRQFKEFKGYHNSGSRYGIDLDGDEQPVVSIKWEDAVEFADWLSEETGQLYRLPTEAEWEYAARAGGAAAYPWGEDSSRACEFANVKDKSTNEVDSEWGMHQCDDGMPVTSPVGFFKPNAFGLYDMIGNAWEFCADGYDNEAYVSSPRENPVHEDGDYRVIRGGAWDSPDGEARVAARDIIRPRAMKNNVGIRLVREAD